MTRLLFTEYIEKQLKNAVYTYDKSVSQWSAWIDGTPGVYAQAPTIEEARADLASLLEEFTLLAVREGQKIRGFPFSKMRHAKTA